MLCGQSRCKKTSLKTLVFFYVSWIWAINFSTLLYDTLTLHSLLTPNEWKSCEIKNVVSRHVLRQRKLNINFSSNMDIFLRFCAWIYWWILCALRFKKGLLSKHTWKVIIKSHDIFIMDDKLELVIIASVGKNWRKFNWRK